MHRRTALATLLSTLLAGCASTPASFYTLSPASGPMGAPSDLAVLVGPVSVPNLVDRPQIVTNTEPNRVEIDEYNRWASPLKGEISRTVAQNLVLMLGTPQVTQAADSVSSAAQFRVILEVQRIDAMAGAWAAFDAVWIVRRTADGQSRSGRTTVHEPLTGLGYGPIAAAYSKAVARLSQEVAEAVRSMAAGSR